MNYFTTPKVMIKKVMSMSLLGIITFSTLTTYALPGGTVPYDLWTAQSDGAAGKLSLLESVIHNLETLDVPDDKLAIAKETIALILHDLRDQIGSIGQHVMTLETDVHDTQWQELQKHFQIFINHASVISDAMTVQQAKKKLEPHYASIEKLLLRIDDLLKNLPSVTSTPLKKKTTWEKIQNPFIWYCVGAGSMGLVWLTTCLARKLLRRKKKRPSDELNFDTKDDKLPEYKE